MAVPFSNTKLRVPRGFQNLLEGLAREVLRSQPDELYAFGAEYFENLIKQREESGIDPTEHGAKMEDRFYNNKAFTQPEIDPSDPNQQDAALAIQTKFRQHAAKQEVEVIREEKAATKIQAGFRGHQGRMQADDIKDESEAAVAAPVAATVVAAVDGSSAPEAEEEVDIDLTDPDVEKAAIKIQASFKGFQTRKTMMEPVQHLQERYEVQTYVTPVHEMEMCSAPEPELVEEEIDIDLNDPEVEQAAIKIQAGFKGMRDRAAVREKKQQAETTITDETSTADPTASQSSAKSDKSDKAEPGPAVGVTETQPEAATGTSAPEAEEEVDIDLTDPDVEAAAVKIQASFKGFKTRKEMSGSGKKTPTNQPAAESDKPADTVTEAPATEQAPATQDSTAPAAADESAAPAATEEAAAPAATEDTPVAAEPAPASEETSDAKPEPTSEQAPAADVPAEASATAEAAPTEQAAADISADPPAEQASTAPAEQAPAEQAPAEQTPAEQAPAEQVPAEQVPTEQAPAATEGQPPADTAAPESKPDTEAPATEQPAAASGDAES